MGRQANRTSDFTSTARTPCADSERIDADPRDRGNDDSIFVRERGEGMVRRALVLKPPRLPLQARSREKRARVLAAVLVLLDELGYGAATIEAVAQ